MAGELSGQAGALAYDIPQRYGLQPPQAAAQEAAAAQQQRVAPALSPAQIGDKLLAEREALTDDYYNNYGILDAYVKDMAKQGVDVFKPDYTQPGGGEAFKTFERMKANYYHGANALAVEREDEVQRAKEEADNKIQMNEGVDKTGFYAGDMSNYHNMQVDPQAVELNKYLGDPFLSEKEATKARNLTYKPIIDKLQAKRAELVAAGKNTEEIDRQLQSYINPIKVNPALQVAGISAASRAEGRYDYDVSNATKLYNALRGNSAPENYTIKSHPKYGKVEVDNTLNGQKAGYWTDKKDPRHISREKIVRELQWTPDHKQGFLVYTDPLIPPDEIKDAHAMLRMIMNATNAGSYDKAMKVADYEGTLDKGGNIIPEKWDDPAATANKAERTKRMGTSHLATQKIQEEDRAAIKKLQTGYIYDDEKIFTLPDGTEMRIEPQGDGKYEITNPDDVYPGEDDEKLYTNLTADDIIAKLNDFDRYEQAGGETLPPVEVEALSDSLASKNTTPVVNAPAADDNVKQFIVEGRPNPYSRAQLRKGGWSDAKIDRLQKVK